MTSLEQLVILAALPLFGIFIYAIYSFVLRPKPNVRGVYSNPKINRRKTTSIITPDGIGLLREIIDEEGDPEFGSEYSTLIVEIEGFTVSIPHVNFHRDCRPYNMKQAFAGGDAPVLLCCVDRNGIRHPEMLDALMTPRDRLGHMALTDSNKEMRRLIRDYAKLKQDMKTLKSDDSKYDALEEMTDRVSRFRQSMLRWMPEQEQGGGGQPPQEGGGY